MNRSLLEVLDALRRVRTRMDTIAAQGLPVAERAGQLTAAVHSLSPSSAIAGCWLRAGERWYGCVQDAQGEPAAHWQQFLEDRLLGSKASAEPPHTLANDGQIVLVERLTWNDLCRAILVLSLPAGQLANGEATIRPLLEAAAAHLSVCLRLEEQQLRGQALSEDLAVQTRLAHLGELAGPLAHEFNNILHVLLLQLAVLEHEVAEEVRAEVTEIRRQGMQVSNLVKQFQQYRKRQQPLAPLTDLNRVVQDTVPLVSELSGLTGGEWYIRVDSAASVPGRLELSPDLPAVRGFPSDLRRLCSFLLTNAAAATVWKGGAVTLRTAEAAGKIRLTVEDTGPGIEAERLPQLFEASGPGRPGVNSLELAACKSLVRRLQGTIEGADCPGGGMAIHVDLPIGSEGES